VLLRLTRPFVQGALEGSPKFAGEWGSDPPRLASTCASRQTSVCHIDPIQSHPPPICPSPSTPPDLFSKHLAPSWYRTQRRRRRAEITGVPVATLSGDRGIAGDDEEGGGSGGGAAGDKGESGGRRLVNLLAFQPGWLLPP
jgi:hypothetical protein